MNKRGRRPKRDQDLESEESEEDHPIARRRRTVKVVQAPPEPVIKTEKEDPKEDLEETVNEILNEFQQDNDKPVQANNETVDSEIVFNGHKNGHETENSVKIENGLESQNVTLEEAVEATEAKNESQALADSLVEDEDEDTRSEVSADEESLPSTFNLGNLAWARVGSAPYWPCLITNDPSDPKEKFTHVKLHKKLLRREYHVHFFGRVQRAWVQQPHMLKFEGLEAFNQLSAKAPKALKPAFYPRNTNKKSWQEAVDECVQLEAKTCPERLEAYKEKETNSKASKGQKRARRSSIEDLPAQKRPKFDDAEKLIEAIPSKILEENKRKLKTGFKLFQLAHSKADSEASEDQEKVISKMWNSASAAEKKYFQDKANAIAEKPEEEVASETSSVASEVAEVKKAEKTPKTPRTPSCAPKPKLIGLFKKESCCYICEEVSQNPVVKCKGACGQSFHQACLGVEIPEVFKCADCATANYKCQLCNTGKFTVFEISSICQFWLRCQVITILVFEVDFDLFAILMIS